MSKKCTRTARLVILALLLAPAPALAADFGWNGWGPRVGVSSDPDQIFGGVQIDLGEFADHVRLQPSAEIGFGDDTTALTVSAMVAYYFPVKGDVTPYAGGQLTAAFYDFKSDCRGFGSGFSPRGRCDDSDTEIGPMAVGGVEFGARKDNRFLAELQLGFGDLPEARLLAGWLFR